MNTETDPRYLEVLEEIEEAVREFYLIADEKNIVVVYEMQQQLIHAYPYSEFINAINEHYQQILKTYYQAAQNQSKILLFIRDEVYMDFRPYLLGA